MSATHKKYTIGTFPLSTKPEIWAAEADLNRLAEAGWVLVAAFPSGNDVTFVMEREVAAEIGTTVGKVSIRGDDAGQLVEDIKQSLARSRNR